jgi:hypothetical protein
MLTLLAESKAPIFDLDTKDGVARLLDYLTQIPGDRWPPPSMPDPELVLQPVLKAIDDLATEVPFSPRYGRWLMQWIARRFELRERSEGPTDGG